MCSQSCLYAGEIMNDGELHKKGVEDGGQEGILRVPSLQVDLCV